MAYDSLTLSLNDPELVKNLGTDEVSFERSFEALEALDQHTGADTHGRLVHAYLALDPEPVDYEWSEDGQGLFEEFRDAVTRDRRKAELEDEGWELFLVERYKHGGVHYSVAGTRNYPDRQWDVLPNALYAPPIDVLNEYREGERSHDELVAFANVVLDEYSDACNGHVYGVVVEVFERPGEPDADWTAVDEDTVWGVIGHAHAEEVLAEVFAANCAPPLHHPNNDASSPEP